MKVETPQILWNSGDDKGKNAPLYSISMLESGIADDKSSQIYGNVLATAGNTSVINLWKICFIGDTEASTSIFQKQKSLTKIEYLTSLARHELPVNTVSFSPDGLHLVTAGEAGNIVIWSVPVAKRGNGNGRHFWSTITKETDLSVRIVSTHCEGVCDISWSGDSKRFVVGTIDACVLVFEDKIFQANHVSPDTHQKSSDWTVVFRSGHDHSQFVQGVAFDPLGAYVATMSSDRTVRVFPRKAPPKGKKKVLRPSNAKGPSPPPEHKRMVEQLLTDAKLELGKSKQLKHRTVTIDETGAQVKQKMFADESTCESFFRRLNWTSDGAFLIAPAALWHEPPTDAASGKPSISPPSFSTYLFARHRYDEPYRVLSGLEKPSVVVRPNPVLFQLPANALIANQENRSPIATDTFGSSNLAYRSVFAVLTLDSVLVYDTYHTRPLAIARGLHYAGLTDATWSKDGLNLMVCSTDGYISTISFQPGELGEIYTQPVGVQSLDIDESETTSLPLDMPPIPPCEPGPTVLLEAPPAKRAKKTRITPTLVSTDTSKLVELASNDNALDEMDCTENPTTTKRCILTETENVGAAVTKLSLDNDTAKPKKKKRIQPTLITTT